MHEFVGVVDAIGDRVTRVRPGDRVVIEPNCSWGVCPLCRERRHAYAIINKTRMQYEASVGWGSTSRSPEERRDESSRLISKCSATSVKTPESVPTRRAACRGTVTWCSPCCCVVLFNGGQGGSADDASVRQRLSEQPRTRLDEEILAPEEDPFLADLVWWKGEHVAVVEASLQVNGVDVTRAAARAATLARAGARAVAVVIGDEWAGPQAAREAEALRVEWKVGSSLSAGFLALRRQSAA